MAGSSPVQLVRYFRGVGVSAGFLVALAACVLTSALPADWHGETVMLVGVGAFTFLLLVSLSLAGNARATQAYLFLVVFLVDASFRAREFSDVSLDWQTGLKVLVWSGAAVIGAVNLARGTASLLKPRLLVLLALTLWAGFSSVYSVTPIYTAGTAFTLGSLLLFSAGLRQQLTTERVLVTTSGALGLFIFTSLIVYFISPTYGRTTVWAGGSIVSRLAGLAGHANNAGRSASLFLLLLFLLYWNDTIKVRRLIAPAILGGYTLFLTQSRTALVALGAAMLFAYARRGARRRALVIGTVIVSLFWLGTATWAGFLPSLAARISRSGSADEVYSLTGRTDIWSYTISKATESPWIGFGYASSRLVISTDFTVGQGWTSTHAHNLLLENLLTLGVIGVSLVAMLLIIQARDVLRDHPKSYFRDSVFAYVLVNGLVEGAAMGQVPTILTLLWAGSLLWEG